MNDNLQICKAQKSDIPSLVSLLNILFSIEVDFHPDEKKQMQGLDLLFEDLNNNCIMIAKVKDRVVGMCTAQILISTAEGGRVARIEDVVILKEYRNMGIGTLLLDSIEEWAVQKGLKRLELLYDLGNIPALEFYRKNKWKKTNLVCLCKIKGLS